MTASLLFSLALCLGAVAATSKINCNDGKFYIRADPESCGHFYKCDNGNPVRFACPSGLYYNPDTHVCDWPRNVKCNVNRQSDYDNNNGQQYNDNNGNNNGQQYKYNNGNNKGQQNNINNGNNNGQQTNDYNENNGQPYKGIKGNHNGQQYNENNQNQNDDSYNYPVQNPLTLDGGPSIQSPKVNSKSRPTVDDLYNGSRHPYQDSLNGNQNENSGRY